MNTDKAGEQSMDEILASIRKIIADDPEKDKPAAGAAPKPISPLPGTVPVTSAPPPAPAEPITTRPAPLLERLNGVLKNGPLPPGSDGSKRPLSFDQDLADLLDEKSSTAQAGSPLAPKPDLRVPLDRAPPSVAKAPETNGHRVPPTLDGFAALPPQLAPSAPPVASSSPLTPPPPFGGRSSSEAESTPRTFPPLTKVGGFYPAQPPTNAPRDEATASARVNSGGGDKDAPSGTISNSTEQALKRVAEIGAALNATGQAPGSSLFGVPPRDAKVATADPADGPVATDGPEARVAAPAEPIAPKPVAGKPVRSFIPMAKPAPAYTSAPATPVSTASVATPVAASSPVTEPASATASAPPATSEPVAAAAPLAVDTPRAEEPSKPAAPTPAPPTATPFAARAPEPAKPAAPEPSNPRIAAGADTVAATQALEALAQGLAVSAAASAGVTAPIALTPQPMATTSGAAASQPVRTLEDAVADMLKPMLQQWVADNMPRIMEKALRAELERSLKPGSKPPGN